MTTDSIDFAQVQTQLKARLDNDQFMDRNPTSEPYVRHVIAAIEECGGQVVAAVPNLTTPADLLASDVSQAESTVQRFCDVQYEGDDRVVEIDMYGALTELRTLGWTINPPVN